MDYRNGKIYKLCSSNLDKCYIGATCSTLAKRKYEHCKDFRLSQNGEKKIKLTTSRFIFEAGGEITIVLVQEFPCANKMELDRRERFHIETNDCVNKNLPARTHDDLLKWKKEYNEANKEQLSQKRKEYAEENKELVAEQCKRYCKRHYQKKKEVILQKRKERVICDICQIEVGRHSLTRHKKRKHSTKN